VIVTTSLFVISLYLLYFYILFHVRPGVSIPSGPRQHKIQRVPQWYNHYWNTTGSRIVQDTVNQHDKNMIGNSEKQVLSQHRYVTGQESHTISEQLYSGCTSSGMTGEPAGRDMWTTTTTTVATKGMTQTTASTVNDELVISLASGGRNYIGFNPHINPNRYVDVHVSH
jgi:hypothetical protein